MGSRTSKNSGSNQDREEPSTQPVDHPDNEQRQHVTLISDWSAAPQCHMSFFYQNENEKHQKRQDAHEKQPLSDSVEVKHRVSLVSAALRSAASGSEQKLQLVCTELEFLCPPPLDSHWN
ncbi:unnamed protein product [Pleuronectes platessa]|uniref:Uncharacterized protein n=1 Tax=Pleuronectes platessa TaxID=8262 RepID=A0A9N7Y7V6_PLEPL|nr:unnamed protein product [Pleuronectes platessa]